jgi:type IV pilus assembly protein PilW
MYNLGPQPILNTWSIQGNRVLVRSEALQIQANPDAQIAEGVINLKAEYGYDTNANGRIDDTPGNAEWLTALPAGADWRRVLAVRVAVLVRSRQFERSADGSAAAPTGITPNQPTYFNGTAFVMTNLDGTPDAFGGAPNTPDPNNWRFYRYRVYEKVIPLRNMIWGTSP